MTNSRDLVYCYTGGKFVTHKKKIYFYKTDSYLFMIPTDYVEALIDGDQRMVSKIYKENLPKVMSFVLKNSGSREDAEDIFQMAVLQITTRYKATPFIIHSSFQAYLFTVCKNLWRRQLNSQKNRVTRSEFQEPVDNTAELALSILEQQRWELFTSCLQKLSENCQKVLTLFFNKIPYRDMVEQLGYNSETVARQRVFKCKAKLVSFVKEHKNFNSLTNL